MESDDLILIADDDFVLRKFMEVVLAREGYKTIFAKDGEEAAIKAKDPRVKLIIIDAFMPRLNGLEASRKIKESININIPIILLTYPYATLPSISRHYVHRHCRIYCSYAAE